MLVTKAPKLVTSNVTSAVQFLKLKCKKIANTAGAMRELLLAFPGACTF